MQQIELTQNLTFSRIIHGYWRLAEWNLSNQELLKLIQQTIDLGITTFDHADIYGNYTCEQLFGDALSLKSELRKNLQLVTKCGIKLKSDKFPANTINSYNYSYKHIISSVENSLKNFKTDYVDVLLLHRPSPFFNPEEVAKAFYQLKQSGKVLHFGVSNFTPQQFEMLSSYIEIPLVTNQVEISPYCLEHFNNGNIDYFLTKRIKPMAWSPLAGGKLMKPTSEKEFRIVNTLRDIANELNVEKIDTLIYAWLLMHPTQIMPVVGSQHIERVKNAVEATKITMNTEQWLKIYIAAVGKNLP
jgi:predicted oxidoreductase